MAMDATEAIAGYTVASETCGAIQLKGRMGVILSHVSEMISAVGIGIALELVVNR